MPSKKDTGLRITDVKVVGGGLSAELCGSPIPGTPKRKSCIAMLSSVDYAWLEGQDAADHYRIAEDAQSVEWPALNRIISVHEILDHSWIIYFWKWSLNRISEDIDVDAIIGCWRRNGFILLHESGMVLMKLVGKGPASDLGGDWKWEKVQEISLSSRAVMWTEARNLSGVKNTPQPFRRPCCPPVHSGVFCTSSCNLGHTRATSRMAWSYQFGELHVSGESDGRLGHDDWGDSVFAMALDALCSTYLRQLAVSSSIPQVGHELARLSSSRDSRAACLPAAMSSGTDSPVRKFISSGVWPRNAECGRRLLCSST